MRSALVAYDPGVTTCRQHHIRIGQTLAATLHMPDEMPRAGVCPVVICAHGLTGTRFGSCYRFVRLGRTLAARGIACLAFDFRGCGESDGEFIDVTCDRLQEDLRMVIDWTAQRADIDPQRIGLCGSSFGAFTTARVAPTVQGLRAACFWAPVARPSLLFETHLTDAVRALLAAQGWLDHRGMPLGRAFFEIPHGEDDGPASLAQTGKPLLIYHAAGDTEVPPEHAHLYADAMEAVGAEAHLVIIEAPDHGMRSVPANDQIIAGTVAWFGRHLG